MALAPRLELRQGQALVMTPQLQQAIKLLQMSNIELTAFVEQELERNPVLEREEGEGPAAIPTLDSPPGEEARAESTDAAVSADGPLPDANSDLDTDYDNLYADAAPGELEGGYERIKTSAAFEDGEDALERLAEQDKSLRDHLLDQVLLSFADAIDRVIAAQLVELIDEAGYLSPDWIGLAARLGVETERVERVLSVLQRFDPPGIGARDLKECLSLQLAERGRMDPMIAALLDHLPLLARRDQAGLMRVCQCDGEDLADMIAEIKRLDPKPGHRFGAERAETLVPDVFVRRGNDGAWVVELNAETLPRLLVDHRYVTRIAADKRAKAYVGECLANANWLIKALDQRARTILKVSSEIVRYQESFLTRGVAFLRPLTLKAVADAIEMHESTVSRVTANKFMATPRGVFELRYFFTAGIANVDGGEAHSAEAVRHRIKALIDAESPAAILSDDRLVEILKAEGIDIARRTVAKYRESLKIPSSLDRRRAKSAMVMA